MDLENIKITPYQLAVAIVTPAESAMLLNLVPEHMQSSLLTALLNISTKKFPIVPDISLEEYAFLEIFYKPYKRIGDILMALTAYCDTEHIKRLIEAVSKKIPDFEAEIRQYLLCFEELIYLSDMDLQTALRKEGLDPLLLVNTSEELINKFLKNVSTRQSKDVIDRLNKFINAPEPEKTAYNKQAMTCKSNFAKKVIDLYNNKKIQGADIPLSEAEQRIFPQRLEEVIKSIAPYDDNTLSWWMKSMADWDDLAVLYHWAPQEFAERMDALFDRPIREFIYKTTQSQHQIPSRREANAVTRLKKTL